ncbi:MAG: NfeD family protein [Bacilli bacterium]|nr:NfeD family protein [Bacilli bacterium]
MLWIWLGIVIALALIEILTINLTTIWFVASGLCALVLSLFVESYVIQFSVFVIGGVLLLLFTRSYLINKLSVINVKTNLDRVIGMQGIVTEEIAKNKSGEVKVDGKRWTAMADETIPKDTIVKIKAIDGVKVIVKKEEI